MEPLPKKLSDAVHKRLDQLAECEDFSNASDPVETLHDLRVASRRLRAFLDVFEPLLDRDTRKRSKAPLRRITRSVRALRDWDVQMGLLEGRRQRAGTDAERAALEHLLERSSAARRDEARRASKRFRTVDFGEVRTSVDAALEHVLSHLPTEPGATTQLAWDLLEPFVTGARTDCPTDDGTERPEELHSFRIDLKRLRYALELFEPVLGAGYRAPHSRIRQLQELLGTHHDLVVLETLVDEHRKELESRGRETLFSGLSRLKGELEAERKALFAQFRAEELEPGWWERVIRGALFD